MREQCPRGPPAKFGTQAPAVVRPGRRECAAKLGLACGLAERRCSAYISACQVAKPNKQRPRRRLKPGRGLRHFGPPFHAAEACPTNFTKLGQVIATRRAPITIFLSLPAVTRSSTCWIEQPSASAACARDTAKRRGSLFRRKVVSAIIAIQSGPPRRSGSGR
jgi:hypothetical protein